MLTVVIQSGGESRRMGRDKGLVPFLGKPMIERVIQRLSPLADEMLVNTNKLEAYQFLGLPLVPDILPGRGPLGGMFTALNAAKEALVALVACDMPFVNPDLFRFECDLINRSGVDVVIPRSSQGVEPFHAVYRRATCLPLIQAALLAEKWRADSWFPLARLEYLPNDIIQQLDPHSLAFWNVNTPHDLRQAEAMAKKAEG
jgi:molybdopterin-guanine dinucleotide biosynthesis protein A